MNSIARIANDVLRYSLAAMVITSYTYEITPVLSSIRFLLLKILFLFYASLPSLIYHIFQSMGPSMMPTISEGYEIQLVRRMRPLEIDVGDLITIQAPYASNRSILKRVVAKV